MAEQRYSAFISYNHRDKRWAKWLHPDDAWRSAWVENVRGECLLRTGRRDEGHLAIQRSSPVLTARWPANTLYGGEAARRSRLRS